MDDENDDEHDDEPPQTTLEEHEATFNAFIKGCVIIGVLSVVVLIFLAIVGT
ncbi:MAG: aa3-type cytochrome c oxidase subunit IV [Pseudomonadota bacterium]